MIVWFNKSCIQTINTPAQCSAKIAAINTIIDTLMDTATSMALNANIKEYRVDDGQTKVMFEYQDISAITAQIRKLQALQEVYLQSGLKSRVVRLIDSKNMPNLWPLNTGVI